MSRFKRCQMCGRALTSEEGKTSNFCPECMDAMRHKLPNIASTQNPPTCMETQIALEEVQAEVLAKQMAEVDLSDDYKREHFDEMLESAKSEKDSVRNHNVGTSDYSKHKIQPWDIWIEYKLNPFDADIIKRVLRHKKTDTRKMDYEKIIHICQERSRQIDSGTDPWEDKND